MKTGTFLMAMIFICVAAYGQTNLYENPDFDKIARRHKIIGIIPFKATVTLRPKQMKDISPEQLERMEQAEGQGIQTGMYSWFLKRKERGKLKVNLQDPATTNAKLKQAGITYENYEEYTPADLAKILEIDAIVMGTFETNKPMSEGASIALGALFGFYGSTNKAVANLFIYNGEDGELLCNYHKGLSGSIGSSVEDLVNILMRKASRRIAYTK